MPLQLGGAWFRVDFTHEGPGVPLEEAVCNGRTSLPVPLSHPGPRPGNNPHPTPGSNLRTQPSRKSGFWTGERGGQEERGEEGGKGEGREGRREGGWGRRKGRGSGSPQGLRCWELVAPWPLAPRGASWKSLPGSRSWPRPPEQHPGLALRGVAGKSSWCGREGKTGHPVPKC